MHPPNKDDAVYDPAIKKYIPIFRVKGDRCFPFLELPAELRTAIYEDLFVAASVLTDDWTDWRSEFEPQLFLTCRQIYQEASSVFYSNTFMFFEDVHEDFDFSRHCFRPCAHRIRNLSFNISPYQNEDAKQFMQEGEALGTAWGMAPVLPELRKFTSLKKFVLNIDLRWADLAEENTDEFMILVRGIILAFMELLPSNVDFEAGTDDSPVIREEIEQIVRRLKPIQGCALEEEGL